MRDLAGKTITLSFRARAGANFSPTSSALSSFIRTGTAEDQGNIGSTGAWTGVVSDQKANTLTTSWQSFTHTAAIGASARELCIIFAATPTGTAGADDWYEVEQIQLEVGSVATPFEHRPYGVELALCQRYYYRATSFVGYAGFAVTTTSARFSIPFQQQMRISPAALTQSGTATDYAVTRNGGGVVTCNAVPTFIGASANSATIALPFASGLTAGEGLQSQGGGNSILAFEAEL